MTPSPKPEVFEQCARISARWGLPFLVAGGHAVNAYGYVRTTLDLDLLIRAEDLSAWRVALEQLGYRWDGESGVFATFSPPPASAAPFPLDLLLVDGGTFAKLQADSRELPFGEFRLPVPAPLHLIAMKLHAMCNPDRRRAGKDLADLMGLVAVCGIRTDGPDFAEVLERYADEPTRQIIRAHLA